MEDRKMMRGILETSELQEIKDDIESLKSNVVTLVQDIRNGSGAVARQGINQLKSVGQDEFQMIEDRVREKPAQSLALAFCAGLIVSYIVGARR